MWRIPRRTNLNNQLNYIQKALNYIEGISGGGGSSGLGWTGGSYSSSTGVVTFASDDGLGFSTGDLRGATGADGQGVPTGGTAGQLLSKIDAADFNTEWVDAPSGSSAVGQKFSAYNNSAQTTNSTSFDDATNWTEDSGTGAVFSFNVTTGVLTINHTGNVMLGANITLEQTTGNNRAQPRMRMVEGATQIQGMRAEGYTRQTGAGDRQSLSVSKPITVTSGDTFKVQIGVNSASYTHRIVSGTASFWAHILS